jgi:hypothetical protein
VRFRPPRRTSLRGARAWIRCCIDTCPRASTRRSASSRSSASIGGAGAETTLSKFALCRHDFSNRELYWELVLPLLYPVPPQMHNTDGDPFSMQRLIFAIDSPAEAFAALKGLAIGQSEDELLQDAQYAAPGILQRVEINWTKRGNSRHKGWETTVLGRIEIDGTQLTAEVNSAQRAAEFKRLVSERLGKKARYRVTEIQSLERLMAEARASPPKAATQADVDQAALWRDPRSRPICATCMPGTMKPGSTKSSRYCRGKPRARLCARRPGGKKWTR